MNWSKWKKMPSPVNCRNIEAPVGPGVYQINNVETGELVLFGISVTCRKRMKSLFPHPFGTGKRNNLDKRKYILINWESLEYRTLPTNTRKEAKLIEDSLKKQRDHIFNT